MSTSVLTLILAGGEDGRLSILSQVRAKPGVPFGGTRAAVAVGIEAAAS